VTLRDRFETQDFGAQRRQLTEAKVKYIVINHPTEDLFEWQDEDGLQEQYYKTYPLIYDGPDLALLQVY
jgi:hypothetical protein